MQNTYRDVLRTMVFWGMIVVVSIILPGCMSEQTTRTSSVPPPAVAGNDFGFDELDAYGQWVSLVPYGRVWKPDVAQSWAPYIYGHWDYTEPDWTWISYEPFGWIVYHYGNWTYDPFYGWVWLPADGPWSPARVEWCMYDDRVCWAPLPPPGARWPEPWELYAQGVQVWNVVNGRDFMNENVGAYRITGPGVRPVDANVRIVAHRPDRNSIERYTGREVQKVNIGHESVKSGKRELQRTRVTPTDAQRIEKFKPEVDRAVKRHPQTHR